MFRRSVIREIYRVGCNTAPLLFLIIDGPTIVVKTIFLAAPRRFLLCTAATGYRTSSFLRRVGSRIFLTLLSNLAYLFLLSSDLGREINFSEVPCPKSLPRHSPSPAEKPGSKIAGEVIFLKKENCTRFFFSNAKVRIILGDPALYKIADNTTTMSVRPLGSLNPYSVTLK